MKKLVLITTLMATILVPTISNSAASVKFESIQSIESKINFQGMSPEEAYAMKLFVHLTGAPIPTFDPRFYRAVSLIKAGDRMGAAQIAMQMPGFLKVRVRWFSIPFVAREKQPKDTLTDLQALIIGIVRDSVDARQILTGNFRYSGYLSLGLPPVSRSNNDHYSQFEQRDLDFDRDLQRVDKQWEDMNVAAGALTSRAWAAAYLDDGGTNRMGVTYSIDAFLCEPQKQWRLRGLPDYYVRRDIDRKPGQIPEDYQNKCRNCHSAMDALGGAFAKLNFYNGELVFYTKGVAEKMNRHADVYPPGYVTIDDSYLNMLNEHPSIDFGWRGPLSGKGITAYGNMLANSKSFSSCMVQKVFESVCDKPIKQYAPELIKPLSDDFEARSYNLRYLFANIVTKNECLSHNITEARK